MTAPVPEDLAPWLEEDWQKLIARHTNQQMPHALMLHGTAGVGKEHFADRLVATLLCEQQAQGGCGQCASCKLILAENHPDLRFLKPLEKETVVNRVKVMKPESTIKVGAVRALSDWLRLTPHYDSYRIAVISPAESMTTSAANALLKTLEEPAARCLVILLVSDIGKVPPTVRSRCQRIRLFVRERDVALNWLAERHPADPEPLLELALGGPWKALEYGATDAMEQRQLLITTWTKLLQGRASIALSVKALVELPTGDILQAFAGFASDTIKLSMDSAASLRHEEAREALSASMECLEKEQWFTLYDQLLRLYRSDSASFKTQAVLEGIFADIRLKHTA